MQDRFKFRYALDNEVCEVLAFDLSDGIEHKCLFLQLKDGTRKIINDYDLSKFMQCTGLKDKNGKLIYEGDIVKINIWFDKIVPDDFEYRYENEKGFALYQIFYNQEKARFEAQCIKYTKEKPYRCFLLEYVPTNHEAIGNIYENKELLEQ